jgi:NitT/TauT family transport system substrate-binding protein
MNKRGVNNLIWISSVVVLAFIIGGFFLFSQKEQKYTGDVEKITLAAYEGDTGLLPYIAEEQGFFEENGLEVEIKNYEAGKLAADAVISGEADISTSADAVLASNSIEHQDLRVLGSIAVANVVGLIARKDSGILQPSDLQGKKIGVTKKSNGEYSLGVFLLYNNLNLQNIEIIDLKPNEIVQELVEGNIDAGFTWEPNLFNAKNQLQDNTIIIKENVPEFYFILLSKKSWLENNSESAKRFMKAILQAESYVSQNEEQVKQFMESRFNYEQSYVDISWENHKFIVGLPQPLILKFEDITNWRIENNLTEAEEIPNYLDYIYFDALNEVEPRAIGISGYLIRE